MTHHTTDGSGHDEHGNSSNEHIDNAYAGSEHVGSEHSARAGSESNINEQLKAKIDDLDLDSKIAAVQEAATAALAQVKEKAGTLLHENRGRVDEFIAKAGATIDEKTDGKYHAKVEKAKASVASGLDRLQDGRPEGTSPSAKAPQPSDSAAPAPGVDPGPTDPWPSATDAHLGTDPTQQ
ncbi:MAG: antitoxin [Actinomycetia bacterium]|nr:antitoxin [Actinomycetes bacterium]